MTENATPAAEPLTEDQQAEMIQTFIKTKANAESAKKSLADEKARLAPYEDAKKAADTEHAEAKRVLFDALAKPGAKFTTPAGVSSLSKPKTTIVRELDMDALVEHLHEQHPEIIAQFLRDVKRTPKPSLTVREP